MKKRGHIIHTVLFLFLSVWSFCQTEIEIKEDANKLFENEQYVEATSLFLRLISLNPSDGNYNYQYGTCLLFNSYKKKDALRYLDFAVKQSNPEPRAFYFYGKALHLNFEFNSAIKYYNLYINKRSKKDDRYNVEREIQMCNNGKRLLTTFTDIVVSEKKEIDKAKFFRLYQNMQTVGGNILVSEEFQSKIDKKKGHTPIIHYPPNAQAIYYSSYGDNVASGKDIYVRRRLPNNEWGDSQKILGEVNTNEDEDFPFMHSSGDFLFFSSKGHNSMGGYDVFMGRLNHETGSFEKVENVDFAISSPDDDLFYVVDSTFQNAYFASARQSQDGKLHVYNVRVARVPIREVIVMGDFLSEINPDNKEMNVRITSFTNNEEIGQIKSNETGKYSFVFPKGGKYNYEVEVGGSENIYKFVVEVPFLDEFRPLKQKTMHANIDGEEVVKIINLFDESVEGAEAMMAEVIRKRSTLDVNVDKFDLKELDAQQMRNKVLSELGFSDMTMREVSEQLEDLAITEQLKEEKVENIESNLNAEIVAKANEIREIKEKQDELVTQANNEVDVARKHELLSDALTLELEINQLSEEIVGLEILKNESLRTIKKPSNQNISSLENEFNTLLGQDKEAEALKLLADNKDLIQKIKSESPDAIVQNLIDQSVAMTEDVSKLRKEVLGYEESKEVLNGKNIILNNKLSNAKKKEAEAIRNEIAENEAGIDLLDEVINTTSDRINRKNEKLSVIDNNIASLQSAMLNDASVAVNGQEVIASLKIGEDVSDENDIASFENELLEIEKEHPELNPNYVPDASVPRIEHVSQIENISKKISNEKESILADQSKSDLEKEEALFKTNLSAIETLNNRIGELETELGDSPENVEIKEELNQLETLKINAIEENKVHNERIAELKNSETPTNIALTKEDMLSEIVENYEEQIDNVENDKSLSFSEKMENLQTIDRKTISELEKALNNVQKEIDQDPTNSELKVKKELISELIKEKEEAIVDRKPQVDTGEQTESDPSTASEILAEITQGYESEIERIKDDESLTEIMVLDGLRELDENVLAKIIQEKEITEEKLSSDPQNKLIEDRNEKLTELIQDKRRAIENYKSEIEVLNNLTMDTPSTNEIFSEIAKNYDRDIEKIESNDVLSDNEKLVELQEVDEKTLAKIILDKEKSQEKLNDKPEDRNLIDRIEKLDELISKKENTIAERAQIIESENNVNEPIASVDAKQELEKELILPFDDEIQKIEESDLSRIEKNKAFLEIINSLAAKLSDKKVELQTNIKRQPESTSLEEQLEIVEAMEGSNDSRREEYVENLRNSIGEEEVQLVISQTDKDYIADIAKINDENARDKFEQLADRERELQEKLTKEIASKKKAITRSWSVSIELEEMALEKALGQSKNRETQAINASNQLAVQPTNENEFIESLRTDILGENVSQIDAEHNELEALKEQDQILETYENQLESEIEQINKEIESGGETEQLSNNKDILTEELGTIQQKRRRISVTVGELQQEFIEPASPISSIDQINEKNQINKELSSELDEINKGAEDNTVIDKAIDANENAQTEIGLLIKEVEAAKSDEEKVFLTNQINERQELTNTNIARIVANEQRKEIEDRENISLMTQEELQKRKRTFSVQIGELTTSIIALGDEIKDAKKRDLPNLEVKQARLISEKSLLEEELRTVEELLLADTPTSPVINPKSVDEIISFNDERQMAGEEEYKEYFEKGTMALDTERKISLLEQELRKKIIATNALIAQNTPEENKGKIDSNIVLIKELNTNIDQLKVDLIQEKYAADELLPKNEEQAMKMQNLVARSIKPIQAIAIATLIQLPAEGFAINTNTESTYSEANPIPVDVESPSGLVYRVQIGAFAKPIPQNLYKEFSPVSGEKIAGTNVTRYMAGFFNSSDKVTQARSDIRGLGYSDAFVVAYCDGERISFGNARRLEASGTCVPKGTNELLVEVAEKTAEKLGIPLTTEIPAVDEASYNQAPGASKADAIEMMQGLFFTVQIGVFNRPVSAAVVYNLPELSTVRLPTGQIRYNTGLYNSIKEAEPRRDEALKRGIRGAFVVAYYKGQRISLWSAQQLLKKEGKGILQSELGTLETEFIEEPTTKIAVRTDSVSSENMIPLLEVEKLSTDRIQIVTKKQFSEFPRDVLNRYNAEGAFYFDELDQRVKSVIYKNEDDLPRLYNFKDDIDTVYIPLSELQQLDTKILSVSIEGGTIPGDLMDWLLRFSYQRDFKETADGLELRIYDVVDEDIEEIQSQFRKFALEAIEVVESQFELEEND